MRIERISRLSRIGQTQDIYVDNLVAAGTVELSVPTRFLETDMPFLHLEPVPPRTSKGELLHFLCAAGGVRREQVGRIDLRGPLAVVEVPPGWVARLVKALDGAALKERRLRAWSTDGGDLSAGEEDHFQRLSRLLEMEYEAAA